MSRRCWRLRTKADRSVRAEDREGQGSPDRQRACLEENGLRLETPKCSNPGIKKQQQPPKQLKPSQKSRGSSPSMHVGLGIVSISTQLPGKTHVHGMRTRNRKEAWPQQREIISPGLKAASDLPSKLQKQDPAGSGCFQVT